MDFPHPSTTSHSSHSFTSSQTPIVYSPAEAAQGRKHFKRRHKPQRRRRASHQWMEHQLFPPQGYNMGYPYQAYPNYYMPYYSQNGPYPGQHLAQPVMSSNEAYGAVGSTGITDPSSFTSSSGSWDSIGHAHRRINRDLLCEAVGASALNAVPNPDGVIPIESLDWQCIARKFPGCTPQHCVTAWKEYYRGHYFVKVPSGVVLYLNHQDLTSSSGSSEEQNSAVEEADHDEEEVREQDVHDDNDNDSENGGRKRKRNRPWEKEETDAIETLQATMGNKWTAIATKLGTGRSGTEVKSYWHNKKQRLALKLLKSDAKGSHQEEAPDQHNSGSSEQQS